MNISKPCVVALCWTLTDTLGVELDVLREPVEFLIGGDDLFEVIEDALLGHTRGQTVQLQIEPEQGFGDYDSQLVFLEPRQLFPAELEPGMTYSAHALPKGCSVKLSDDRLLTVTDIYPDHVILDGNHPLAGIALRLTLHIAGVREPTDDELSRRSAGAGFFRVAT
ncbi:MAG: peptidylprolyl isomerase [Rhodoferax sp.]